MKSIPVGPLAGTVVEVGDESCVLVLWPAPNVATVAEVRWDPRGSSYQAQYACPAMVGRVKAAVLAAAEVMPEPLAREASAGAWAKFWGRK